MQQLHWEGYDVCQNYVKKCANSNISNTNYFGGINNVPLIWDDQWKNALPLHVYHYLFQIFKNLNNFFWLKNDWMIRLTHSKANVLHKKELN